MSPVPCPISQAFGYELIITYYSKIKLNRYGYLLSVYFERVGVIVNVSEGFVFVYGYSYIFTAILAL